MRKEKRVRMETRMRRGKEGEGSTGAFSLTIPGLNERA
jgi:hypothetical protein